MFLHHLVQPFYSSYTYSYSTSPPLLHQQSYGMKIPQPLEKIFDRFPLQTYPSAPNQGNGLSKVHFVAKLSKQPSSHFTLGVHSIRKVEVRGSTRYLATDPAGLAAALILCHRHGLGLPTETHQSLSPHSIASMSYLAAQDNQLPILVETSGVTTKCVTLSSQIVLAVASRSFATAAIDATLNSFLDGLQTLWVFTLLHEISFSGTAILSNVFQDDGDLPFGLLDSVKLVEDIQGWCSFKEKYSHLYPTQIDVLTSPAALIGLMVGSSSHSIASDSFKKAYAAEIAEFFKTLPMCAEYVQAKNDGTAESAESKDILEIKLASFVLTSVYFLPEKSVLRSLLTKDHEKLIEWCEHILLKY